MSEAESSSAAVKSSGRIALQATAADDGWRESVLVLVMVLAPIGLAVIVAAIGLSARAAWQIAHRALLKYRRQRALGSMRCCPTRSAAGSLWDWHGSGRRAVKCNARFSAFVG